MFLYLCLFLLCLFMYFRLSCGRNKSATCLVGKTAIITGGNAGLGYQVALNLASRGCRVIIAARNNLEEAKRDLIKHSKNPHIECHKLDLSSFESVRAFAEKIKATESRLDILMNNSGIPGSEPGQLTRDGLHPVMQINYFGAFLLTHLLIDLLKKSSPSRIIFNTSNLSYLSWLSLKSLKVPKCQSSFIGRFFIYNNSKVAQIIASDIFAKKLEGTGVTSIAVHPGWVRTSIFNKFKLSSTMAVLVINVLNVILYFTGKSVFEGGEALTHAIVSNDLENVTGKFFCDCRQYPKPLQARNSEFCEKVWRISEECVNLTAGEKL